MLYEMFYLDACGANSSFRRLFNDAGMQRQIKAFVDHMKCLILALDDFPKFLKSVMRTAAMHRLYGVTIEDYSFFATILGSKILAVLGQLNNQKWEPLKLGIAWTKHILNVGNLYTAAGNLMDKQYVTFNSYRKMKSKNAGWKLSTIAISLGAIFVFQNTTVTQLRSKVPFSQINEIVKLTSEEVVLLAGKSYPFGFQIHFGLDVSNFTFATEDKFEKCFNLLSDRYNATQRATQFGSFEDIGGSSSASHVCVDAASMFSGSDACSKK